MRPRLRRAGSGPPAILFAWPGKGSLRHFALLLGLTLIPHFLQAEEGGASSKLRQEAEAHYQAVELEDAAVIYRELVEANPDDPALRTRLAECLTRTDQFQEAIEHARKAVVLSDRDPEALAALGLALYRQGSFNESQRLFREGLEKSPTCARCHWGLARCLEIIGDGVSAAEHYRAAASQEPENPVFLRHLAGYVSQREARKEIYRNYLQLPRREEKQVWENVRAWLAVLEALGDRPMKEMVLPDSGTELPLEARGGLHYLSIQVGKKKNRRYLFDTGASGVTITTGLMKRLKLTPVASYTITGVGGKGTSETKMVILDQIMVGEATIRNVPAVVSDALPLVDGVLGPTLFGGLQVQVSYRKRRLTIGGSSSSPSEPLDSENSGSKPSRRKERTASATVEIPFLSINGTPFVPIQVAGQKMNAMVDTGGSQAVLSRFAVEQTPGLELLPPGLGPVGNEGIRGATGDWEDVQVVHSARIEFGGRTLEMTALSADRERLLLQHDLTPMSHSMGTEVWAILGNPQLDDFDLTFDFARQILRLTPHR